MGEPFDILTPLSAKIAGAKLKVPSFFFWKKWRHMRGWVTSYCQSSMNIMVYFLITWYSSSIIISIWWLLMVSCFTHIKLPYHWGNHHPLTSLHVRWVGSRTPGFQILQDGGLMMIAFWSDKIGIHVGKTINHVFGNGNHATYKNGDDLGMVHGIVLHTSFFIVSCVHLKVL